MTTRKQFLYQINLKLVFVIAYFRRSRSRETEKLWISTDYRSIASFISVSRERDFTGMTTMDADCCQICDSRINRSIVCLLRFKSSTYKRLIVHWEVYYGFPLVRTSVVQFPGDPVNLLAGVHRLCIDTAKSYRLGEIVHSTSSTKPSWSTQNADGR